MKRLIDIAWNVDEKEYRESLAFSYSSLALFSREGIHGYINRKKEETDALKFGSLVDTLLTEPDKIQKKYFIFENKVQESVYNVVKEIFNNYSEKFNTLNDVDKDKILYICNLLDYQKNWRDDTRVSKILEFGEELYTTLQNAKEKVIITKYDMEDAEKCIEALKSNNFTSSYFTKEDIFNETIEEYYQIKFKTILENNEVKCMFDNLKVDHTLKTIQPIDFKTTGDKEENFISSFFKWKYFIQASLYTDILKNVLSKDEYFKDFTVLPFKFIVISRYSKLPLVYTTGEFFLNGNDFINYNGKVVKNYKTLLKELEWHLSNNLLEYSFETYQVNGDILITIDD